MNAVRSQLYVYMKLMNGGFSKSSEIDFADSALSRKVVFSETEWVEHTENLICPIGYFRYDPLPGLNSNSSICFREGQTLTPTFSVLKSSTNYTIYRESITFNNYYLSAKGMAESLYNMSWILNDVMTKGNNSDNNNFPKVLNPQKNNLHLTFPYHSVSGGSNSNNPGVYNLSFTLQDR